MNLAWSRVVERKTARILVDLRSTAIPTDGWEGKCPWGHDELEVRRKNVLERQLMADRNFAKSQLESAKNKELRKLNPWYHPVN